LHAEPAILEEDLLSVDKARLKDIKIWVLRIRKASRDILPYVNPVSVFMDQIESDSVRRTRFAAT